MTGRTPPRIALIVATVVGLLTITSGSPAIAAAGDLDPNFSNDGTRIVSFSPRDAGASDTAIQSDGKIVIAGSVDTLAGYSSFALARLNPDGTRDLTFGDDGKIVTNFVVGYDGADAVAIQSNGRIVTAGYADDPVKGGTSFAVARYRPDGTLDPTFGDGGLRRVRFGQREEGAESVLIQADGKILVGGTSVASTSERFALARLNPDGTLDPTFGTSGKVVTASAEASAQGLVLQSDGMIVVAGASNTTNESVFYVARYRADGTLDPNFGGGVVTKDLGCCNDLGSNADTALQGDGSIVVAGTGPGDHFVLLRYAPDGVLDPTFSGDGIRNIAFETTSCDWGSSVAVQSDGKILEAGSSSSACGTPAVDFAVARLNLNGSLDKSFGGDGRITTDFNTKVDGILGLRLQDDGRIVAVGSTRAFTSGQGPTAFAVARYLAS
jgi:uncharacterized delta-60 repeat protein